jgi:hypothetical protein
MRQDSGGIARQQHYRGAVRQQCPHHTAAEYSAPTTHQDAPLPKVKGLLHINLRHILLAFVTRSHLSE